MRSLPFANSGLMTFGWLEHKKRLEDRDNRPREEGCPHHTAKKEVDDWLTADGKSEFPAVLTNFHFQAKRPSFTKNTWIISLTRLTCNLRWLIIQCLNVRVSVYNISCFLPWMRKPGTNCYVTLSQFRSNSDRLTKTFFYITFHLVTLCFQK